SGGYHPGRRAARLPRMTQTFQNIVNGKPVDSSSGQTYDVVNPATGESYATAPASSAEDVDRAYQAAATAFETWRDTTPAERQRAMLKIADALEERTDAVVTHHDAHRVEAGPGEFVKTGSETPGKPLGFTESEELPPAIDQIRFFAGAARVL